ncbi:heme biosynthesis HemY N-terminal domain-containing protein [Yanghanlia caeni]|uniref:Heme biosynthesis HemY N-terminal domain-containing protein n=1 Tax=Yanghanlia caeni TaxID=3064283 RepID=A0ABU1D6B2_9BURK|nr:heme biosynthesis HemY N-terminal domain-containing protein [Alcaligenaceae bacterium LG-2]NGR06428.1 heme biosynthesis protein HemY [bacterium SGD-2]HZH57723.1 heme biosynthesis HemY N-terminal domain-containing protein [Burkholderiaceae bacterium]
MRTWFWTLVVFVAAVALALVLRDHSGNVVIVAQPWRIELSLTLAVLLLVATFVILHFLLRVFYWLGSRPERFRSWRSRRSVRRDQESLESGWINVLEGRYGNADKDFGRVLNRTRSEKRKVLAALASAHANHHLGEFGQRDKALALARQAAGDDIRLREAWAIVAAEMYLDQNRPQDALALLQPLQDASSRYLHATRLLLRAHRQLNNHDRVYDLTRLLLRRGVIDKAEASQLIEVAGAARLHTAGAKGFKAIWGDLKAEERTMPEIALAAAAIQAGEGNHDEASRILEAAISVKPDPRLLSAYSQCPPQHVSRRLAKAEEWLKRHPDDAALLAAMGNLCLTGQLWGPGELYLKRSMALRNDMRVHALLGNLYDRLGRRDEAMRHWRLAAGVVGVLPVLPRNHFLPAADTRGDPTLIDVEIPAEPSGQPDTGTPVAASAVDYVVEESHSPGQPQGSAGAEARKEVESTVSDNSGLDEFFDSAPIPGVDVSQTSDGPRRGH